LSVTDNGPGATESNGTSGRPGIGLNNTRARLHELYGHAQKVEVSNGKDRGFIVEITIPFRIAAGQKVSIDADDYENSHTDCGR
jgi:sensor histidine kinase YesM